MLISTSLPSTGESSTSAGRLRDQHDVLEPAACVPAGVGAFATTASPISAQRTDYPPSDRHGPAGRAPGRSSRKTPTSTLSGCSRRNRFGSRFQGATQPQSPLDLPTERPIDRKTTGLRPTRPPAGRTLRGHRPVTATVTGHLPRPSTPDGQNSERPRSLSGPTRSPHAPQSTDEPTASTPSNSGTITKRPTSPVLQSPAESGRPKAGPLCGNRVWLLPTSAEHKQWGSGGRPNCNPLRDCPADRFNVVIAEIRVHRQAEHRPRQHRSRRTAPQRCV